MSETSEALNQAFRDSIPGMFDAALEVFKAFLPLFIFVIALKLIEILLTKSMGKRGGRKGRRR